MYLQKKIRSSSLLQMKKLRPNGLTGCQRKIVTSGTTKSESRKSCPKAWDYCNSPKYPLHCPWLMQWQGSMGHNLEVDTNKEFFDWLRRQTSFIWKFHFHKYNYSSTMLSHLVFTVEVPNSSTVLEIPNVLIFMKIQNILSKKIKYTQTF